MVYREIFVYTNYFFDFMKGFEIVERIFDAIPHDQAIGGCNFNRYGVEGKDSVPHITVRLNLENEIPQEVKDLLENMKEQDITCWRTDNPLVTPFREYSTNHHVAHETSTACAFKFYNEMKRNLDEFQKFVRDKIRYLSDFLPLWLKKCGFRKLDNLLIRTSQFIESLANKCAEAFQDTIDETRITDKYIFTERFIHTFLNCICISSSEEFSIIFGLMHRVLYTDLSTSLEI